MFWPLNCMEYFIDQILEKDAQIDFYFIKIYCTVYIFTCSNFCPDTNAHPLNVSNVGNVSNVQKKTKKNKASEC